MLFPKDAQQHTRLATFSSWKTGPPESFPSGRGSSPKKTQSLSCRNKNHGVSYHLAEIDNVEDDPLVALDVLDAKVEPEPDAWVACVRAGEEVVPEQVAWMVPAGASKVRQFSCQQLFERAEEKLLICTYYTYYYFKTDDRVACVQDLGCALTRFP